MNVEFTRGVAEHLGRVELVAVFISFEARICLSQLNQICIGTEHTHGPKNITLNNNIGFNHLPNTRRRSHANFCQSCEPPTHRSPKTKQHLYQENSVQAAIVLLWRGRSVPVSMHAAKKGSYLWVVCDLGVATPGNLARGRDNTEVGDVDLDAATWSGTGPRGARGGWIGHTLCPWSERQVGYTEDCSGSS